MGLARVVEVDYYVFVEQLRRATDEGGRIEPSDKQAWDEYVRQHNIRETAINAIGKVKFESVIPVIINLGDSWDGYYVYSNDAEACLKWVES